MHCSSSPAKGPARDAPHASWRANWDWRSHVRFIGYLDRRTRTAGLLRRRRCLRVRLAHRDPGAGAARGHGAGHAGGVHRRAWHALHSHAKVAARSSCRRMKKLSRPRPLTRWPCHRKTRAALDCAHAESWASLEMARRLMGLLRKGTESRRAPRSWTGSHRDPRHGVERSS